MAQYTKILDKSMKSFFIKIFILTLIWKLLHFFWLGPIRIPDAYLTDIVTTGTVWLTNFLHFLKFNVGWIHHPFNSLTLDGLTNTTNGTCFFVIDDTCNGLEIMLIYIGILLLLPYKFNLRKLLFILGGLIVLITANMIRCTALLWLFIFHHKYFDINHHYVFTFIMYGIIISGWLLFMKKRQTNEVK